MCIFEPSKGGIFLKNSYLKWFYDSRMCIQLCESTSIGIRVFSDKFSCIFLINGNMTQTE